MMQRELRLRREVATTRHTPRAAMFFAVLLQVMLISPLLLAPAAAVGAAPTGSRSRTVKPRHEAMPVAVPATHAAAKASGRNRPAAGKVRLSSRASAAKPETSPRRGRPVLASARSAGLLPERSHGRRHPDRAVVEQAMSSRSSRRHGAHSRNADARRAEVARRVQPASQREIAMHKAAISEVPRGAQDVSQGTAGGELTIDDFAHVVSAASNGRPMVGVAKSHTAPPVQRVDGFGAEGALLNQPPTLTPGGMPPTDTVTEAAVANLAVGDFRVRALVHPSHEEMAEELAAPVVLPGLYRNGRLVVPAPMKGSHDILVHQNTMADGEGLERVRNEDELQRLRATRQLVDFPESASLRVNSDLGSDRRCARVWTVKFAQDTAHAFYARFHEPLQVNSAVRTIAYQLRLQRTNGNAAGISGEASSPHLTGQAIDFGKRGMTVEQIAWMRAYLGPLMAAGKVDVEEEFQQACFHISVYKSYLPQVPAARRMQVAAVTRPTAEDQ